MSILKHKSAFVIAGTSSGCGKTTISMGVMAALTKMGKVVNPYKVGPDYIDPGFHQFVTGCASHNLDLYMCGDSAVKEIFNQYATGDVAVVEGVMGMYDGLGITCQASSADVAKTLELPVVLVVDGKGVSSSIAAQVMGFQKFDEDVNIAGVIINRVSSYKHYTLLKKAIELYCKVPVIGYLPKDETIALNSRHLGLIPHGEVEALESKINKLAMLCKEHIECDKLLDLTKYETASTQCKEQAKWLTGKRIGVAKDIAFTFYYQANLDLLEQLGATLVYFSPMKDKVLPQGVDALYIGGGFPEVFAKELAENIEFISSLKQHLEDGLPCYAECGGFMYLTKSIETLEGKTYNMVGLFNATAKMTKRLQNFGYIELRYNGHTVKAHEFHRSLVEGELNYQFDIEKKRDGEPTKQWQCGAKYKNVITGYPHVHFYSNVNFLKEVFKG